MMLSLDDEDVHYNILQYAQGTATRQSEELLRKDIINTYIRTNRRIILNFDGIKNVSSSFIDEVIAKLIIEFGMLEFMQLFPIINMNSDIRYLANRSIYMRIHDEWEKVIEDTTSS